MRLQPTIVTLLLLSSSFCASMHKPQATIDDIMTTLAEIKSLENSNIITPSIETYVKDFQKKWDYEIPGRLVQKTIVTKIGMKKTVCIPESYIDENKKISEKINIDNLLTKSKKIIQAPKTNNGLNNKKKLVEQKIAQPRAEKKISEQQLTLIEKKHPKTLLPSEQKMIVLRSLMKKYQAKNPVQLKQKLSELCVQSCCLYVRFNPYCTWRYCSEKNILDIDTNDPESSDSSDETESESD
jgi:hypothetical protein